MNKIYLGLVEDQHLFREGLKAILSARIDMEVVFEASEGHSVVQGLQNCATVPHVLLVDLSLPAHEGKEFNGLHVTTAVRETFPEIKVLILSVHNDDHFIARLIEQGAHGYLMKDSDPAEVFHAIMTVHTHGSYINDRTLKAIQNNAGKKTRQTSPSNPLTKREEEVLRLVCQQHTAEEIAEKLFISVKTVNGHRNNLLQKTGAKNVAGLVVYAFKNNLIMAF